MTRTKNLIPARSTLARACFSAAAMGATGLGLLSGLGAPVSTATAAPEPAPVATEWEFTFENGPLRLAWVQGEDGISKPYFYLTYRITNHWGGVKLFSPDVSLMADNANLRRSGRGVSAAVTEEIMGRLDNPLLESPSYIVSNVLEGPEHARDGIVIWPAEDLQADEITIFFAGLSGEQQSYIVGRDTQNPVRYNLRKTLMLRYSTPGELAQQGDDPFELAEKRWVMR